MNVDLATTRLLRTLLIGGTIVIAMSVAADVLKPIALAILVTFLLTPTVARLERLGIPRVLSAAAVLIAALSVVSAIGYVVGNQFVSLAEDVPRYTENIRYKVARLKPTEESTLDKVLDALENLGNPTEISDSAADEVEPMPVRVIAEEPLWGRIHTYLGPFESIAAMGGVVLLLVVFLLLEREEIGNKIIQLVGWGQIGVTTKALSQIGEGLSKYLRALALVNISFGTVIGLGAWAIGLPSPALWGFLAATLRFIPYVGTLLAFAFPLLIAIAAFPGWKEPILLITLFITVELVVNSIEPLLYGKSTGISPIGLLISALFWAWLWGPLGLLLANALTVCLAVSGRSIPGLNGLGILLSHDVRINDDMRWYQRVLNHDLDGSLALLDDALKTQAFEDVCDRIVIPTLSRAEQDRAQGTVDNRDVAFIWRTVREWLDDLADRDDLVFASSPSDSSHEPLRSTKLDESAPIIGVATGGGADALVLRMLNMSLKPSGVRIAIMTAGGPALSVLDKIVEESPSLVLISHLPPMGLTRARYLTKRMRARDADVPVVFGFWEVTAETPRVIETLKPASASRVVVSLASARVLIQERIQADQSADTASAPPLIDSVRN